MCCVMRSQDAPIRDMSELESQVLELDKKISSAKDCWANAAAAQQKAAAHLEQVLCLQLCVACCLFHVKSCPKHDWSAVALELPF